MTFSRLSSLWVCLTLTYLAFPLGLFSLFWLRTPFNGVCLLLLGAALWNVFRAAQNGGADEKVDSSPFPWRTFWIITLPLLIALPLAGEGRFVTQEVDWAKHNAILFDLTTTRWPISYPTINVGGKAPFLLYYLGYYLPAGGVGQLCGSVRVAELALLFWTGLGILLVGGWLTFLTGGRLPWVGGAFLFYEGLKKLGFIVVLCLFKIGGLSETTFHTRHLFFRLHSSYDYQRAHAGTFAWWAGYRQFHASSPWGLLCWVPQHALGGWLGSALLIWAAFRATRSQSRLVWAGIWLCPALVFFWSAFGGIGTTVLASVVAWNQLKPGEPTTSSLPISREKVQFGIFAWVGLIFLGLLGCFFLSRDMGGYQDKIPLFPLLTWWADGERRNDFIGRWFLFLFFEFGFYFLLARRLRSAPTVAENRFLIASGVTIAGLALIHLGEYSDLLTRGIVPLQFFWLLWFFNALYGQNMVGERVAQPPRLGWGRFKQWEFVALMVALIWSATYSLSIMHQHFSPAHLDRGLVTTATAPSALVQRFRDDTHGDLFRSQYLGRPDSLFARFFLAPTHPANSLR